MKLISLVLFIYFCCVNGNIVDQHFIKHVVVLMMENRAFDHILGFMHQLDKNVVGLTGMETNPLDPANPKSPLVKVTFDAPNHIEFNPGHRVKETEFEIYGHHLANASKPFPIPKMNGFIAERHGGPEVMRCYNSTSLPALYTLASEFALFDHFFASIPGPTEVNRMFLLSGQSDGLAANDWKKLVEGCPQRTFFNQLHDEGISFGMYASDLPSALFLKEARQFVDQVHDMPKFYKDAELGLLPSFSFLEPRYFSLLDWAENDMHPHPDTKFTNGNVVLGMEMIRDVYQSLRASKAWNDTLLILTWDEHGGLPDFVPPPQDGVPAPNDKVSEDPPFAFDRLGLRVPFIAISPWIDAHTVVHAPSDGSHYDHTSVMKTIRRMWNMTSPPLGAREAWVASFEDKIFRSQAQGPRTDCPETLPVSPLHTKGDVEAMRRHHWSKKPINKATWAAALQRHGGQAKARATALPITDFQEALVHAAVGLGDETTPAEREIVLAEAYKAMENEFDAALFIRKRMAKWLARK